MNETNTVNQLNSTPVKTENKFLSKIKPIYTKIDSKLRKIVPNDKLRKIIIYVLLGLVVFVILLLLLGIFVSTTRPKTNTWYSLNKPSIFQNSPEPDKPKTEMQTKLIQLRNEISDLKFPPSELTPPAIEVEIEIR